MRWIGGRLHLGSWKCFNAKPPCLVSSIVGKVFTRSFLDRLASDSATSVGLPVDVEEQCIRQEARRGFPNYLLRFRLGWRMESLDEWNMEWVLVNSHDADNA